MTSPRWNETRVKVGGGEAAGREYQAIAAPKARPVTAAAATNSGQRGLLASAAIAALAAVFVVVPVRASSAKARSFADWKRCSGCFSKQRRTMRSSPGETG